MEFALFLLGLILAAGSLVLLAYFIVKYRRHKLFKPLTRISPHFGMRAAAHDFDQTIPHIGGRRRAGSVCFVTGTLRTKCACADCRGERR